MISIKCIRHWNHQIYPVTVRMKILGKSDSQRKNKHKACRYFVYIQHALLYLLCLPSFSLLKITWCMSRKWYPDKILMISFKRLVICKFWYSRKWFMISSDKSDDPQKFLNVSPRGSADILEFLEHPRCFFDDTVRELFLRNFWSSEIFILRKLWWHPQNKISISFQKRHPPKCPILSFENVAMLFIFL